MKSLPASTPPRMQPPAGSVRKGAGESSRDKKLKTLENQHTLESFSTLVKNPRENDDSKSDEDKTAPISALPGAAPVLAQGVQALAAESVNERGSNIHKPENIPDKTPLDERLVKPQRGTPKPPRSLAQQVCHAAFPDARRKADNLEIEDAGLEKSKDINVQKNLLASDKAHDEPRPSTLKGLKSFTRHTAAATASHGRKSGRIQDRITGNDIQYKVSLNVQERHFTPVNTIPPAGAYESAGAARQVMRAVDGAIPHLIARQKLPEAAGIKVVKRLEIQLHPASLGTVTARLSLSGGELKITISVPDQRLADHLKRRLDPLVRKIHARYPAMGPASVSIITQPAASPAPAHSAGGAGVMDTGGLFLSGNGPDTRGQPSGQEGQRHVFTDDRLEENHAQAKNTAPDAAGHPSGDDSIYL